MTSLSTLAKRVAPLYVIGLVVFSLGCIDPEDLTDAFDDFDSPCSGATESVSGRWVISGKGERTGCDREEHNGRISFEANPITVSQSGDTLAGSAAPGPATAFSFQGDVSGSCVDFQTEEKGPDGTQNFSFTGEYDGGRDEIKGSFTGAGPRGCQDHGNFTVSFQ